MADEAASIVLEHLRGIRATVDAISIRMDDMTARVSRIEETVAVIVTSLADMNRRLDHLDQRVSRIVRRLELVDG